MKIKSLLVPLISLCLVTGMYSCKSAPQTQSDGAPNKNLNVSKIKDATPKHEPYSTYGNPKTYQVLGKQYEVWDSHLGYKEQGIASWYGTKFHGRLTSSREPYDMYAMTAAHKNLPIPSYAKVTNIDNGKSIIVRINDRGPFAHGRIIDLSYAAATKLDMLQQGTARVVVEAIDAKGVDVRPATYQPTTPAGKQVYLQVAAFKDEATAQELATRLERATKSEASVIKDKTYYRVQVGPFTHEAAASDFKQHHASLNIHDAFVVRR